MGNFLLSLVGIALASLMIKYREKVGDMIGEADWMQKVGGVYNLIIIVALLIFFFSIAKMTGTTDMLLAPLFWFIPGSNNTSSEVPAF